MRTLKDCQAEVFRRSEERIKKRKSTQKRLIIACIPVVLCVCLSPWFLPQRSEQSKGTQEMVPEQFTAQQVQVTGSGLSQVFTDPQDVQAIRELLFSWEIHLPESAITGGTGENMTTDPLYGAPTQAPAAGFPITITLTGEHTTVYLWSDHTLVNQTTQQSYPLTQAQETVLETALGIGSQ